MEGLCGAIGVPSHSIGVPFMVNLLSAAGYQSGGAEIAYYVGEHDHPEWLRRLAAAVLLQALRDIRRPADNVGVKEWMEASGPMGESVHTIVSVLGISREQLLAAYARFDAQVGEGDESEDWLRHFVDRGD